MLLKINFDMVKLFYKISPENILEALKEEIILQFRDVLIDGLKHNIKNLNHENKAETKSDIK